MTKEELEKLIIGNPEEMVEITKEDFDKYLKLFDKIGKEEIKALHSSMLEKSFYYSPTIREILDKTSYKEWYICLIKDYCGGYAPDLEPVRYYVNKNFEKVLRIVIENN